MALYRVELMNPKTPSRRSVKFVRADSRDRAYDIVAVNKNGKWKMGKYRITSMALSTAPDYGVSDNPKSRLNPHRLTPVAFHIRGQRHTGKAKLVGGKVKIYVTPGVARRINPSLSAGGRPHVVSSDGTVRYVKNLGWILRQWKSISRLTWETQGDHGVFRADMNDGSVYTTDYASFAVFRRFIDRPTMRGLPIYINGKKYAVGSPEFKALKESWER